MAAKRWLAIPGTALLVWTLVVPAGGQAPPDRGQSPQAQAARARRVVSQPRVVPADRHDVSDALREIPRRAPRAGRVPHPPLRLRQPGRRARVADPVLQMSSPAAAAPNTFINFEGVGNLDAVLPPDTNGDIGPNHYVQWVNTTFAVYSRSGSLLYGPASGNTIWSGFGGPCESQDDGDPIVLYDHLADRWLLSQFALPNNFFGLLFAPFYQCLAVSQTPDPTGPYYRYQFQFSKLNDYPKFGVWPDGYYMAINQFSAGTLQFAGQGVVAFNRAAMLAGQPAAMIYFDLASVDPNLGGMLPADLDGPPPAAGSPNYYVQMDDDAFGYSQDQLELWRFHADWTTPSASTFTGPFAMPVAAFDSNLCDYARGCIPQPGTSARLDAIADRLMYRLQYRNFGDHQSLVVNHTVDVDGSDRAGVRWYEIRDPGGTPVVHQQGTYAPDTFNRWMASAAMDAAGNLALAYNVSSATLAPSIRYAARLAGDPPGVLAQGENDLISGSGSQTHPLSRWGDYSMLAVDPTDGCTFWATAEYFAATSSAGWQTRIGAFRLPGCGSPVPPPEAPAALTATSVSSARIDLAWSDQSSDEIGFTIERCSGAAATCVSSAAFSHVGGTGAGLTTYADSALVPGSTYSYRVRAFNGGGTSPYSNVAEATTQPPPSVTVTATVATATEAGPASGVFTIARNVVEPSALNVTYSLAGTAVKGNDYQAPPTSVTIPSGAASAAVAIVPIDDTFIESNETVALTIVPATGYVAGSPGSATLTIVSDELAIDLVVPTLSVPASAAAGTTILVTDTTKNQGADAAGASVTSFYLSTNYILDAADTPIGTHAVPALAAGASSSTTTSLALPGRLEAGTYVVFAKADGPEQIAEMAETNNARPATLRVGADLVVSALTAPAAAGAGVAFVVTESTKNQGAGAAGASSTRFYLSANYLLDASDTPLQTRAVAALEPGATSSATTLLTIPTGTAVGTYYLIANADDPNAIAEHTETNNSRSAVIRVGGDVVVDALVVSASRVGAGSTIVVTDTTKNTGAQAVGASVTAFYFSSNFALDSSDVRLAPSRAVPALAAGASNTGTTTITVPDVATGMWYLVANADDGNTVGETTETNNTRSTLLVVGPDLTIATVTVPLSAPAGSAVLVTDTVRNIGGGTAASSTTRFYLSTNLMLDASDVLLDGVREVPALAANAMHTGTTSVTLAAGVAGQYYIIAVADGAGVVAETSETNNILVRGIQIGG